MQKQTTSAEIESMEDTSSPRLQHFPDAEVTSTPNFVTEQNMQEMGAILTDDMNTIHAQSTDAPEGESQIKNVTMETDNLSATKGGQTNFDEFILFPKLPIEFRSAIWKLALPDRRYVQVWSIVKSVFSGLHFCITTWYGHVTGGE